MTELIKEYMFSFHILMVEIEPRAPFMIEKNVLPLGYVFRPHLLNDKIAFESIQEYAGHVNLSQNPDTAFNALTFLRGSVGLLC